MPNSKDLLVAWLNDAYAMEQGLVPVLQNHAADVKDNPQAQQRIQQHIDETRRHAERIQTCVQRLGTTTSKTKSALATVVGSIQSVSTGMFSDEKVKNALIDYSAEQFEVACYRALIAAAREHGDQDIVRACEENMREDENMARWLDQQLPSIVRTTMEKQAAGATPGRTGRTA
jgi:ferritin-like metal-binding protein YciE